MQIISILNKNISDKDNELMDKVKKSSTAKNSYAKIELKNHATNNIGTGPLYPQMSRVKTKGDLKHTKFVICKPI